MKSFFSKCIYVFAFILIALEFLHTIPSSNQDIWIHILLGRIILTHHTIPQINLFSYSYPTFPFINSHWLSEVVLYCIFHFLGFNGLVYFSTAVGAITYLILFFSSKKYVSLLSFVIVITLSCMVIFERTDVRPELFSFLFLAVLSSILYKNKEKFTNYIFILIPIEFLWVNLHIYFILGCVVTFFFLLDACSESLRSKKTIVSQKTQRLFLVFLLSITVTLINPNYVKGALFPLLFLNNYGFPIGENLNLIYVQQHFFAPTVFAFELTVFLVGIVFIVNRKLTSLIDWLLYIFFAFLGFFAIRNIPLFIIVCFIPFIRYTTKTIQKIKIQFSKNIFIVPSLYMFFFFVFSLEIFILPLKKGIGAGIYENYKPAVNFLAQRHLTGNLYNNFNIGAYLDYRLYPKKVFVDNRPEAYPVSFFQNIYLPMQEKKDIFYRVDKKYHFQAIIFSKDENRAFLSWMQKDTKWRSIYEDAFAVILIRKF